MIKKSLSTHSDKACIAQLDARRNKIFSRTGGWFPGRGVFSHGYAMLDELVGEKTYMQIVILNATGKLVSKALADWVEACYGCLSWPDPRIWCNQIGALAGSARSTVVAATALGCMAADSRSYGSQPLIAGLEFIQQAMAQHRDGMSAEAIVEHAVQQHRGKPYIVGYIRPIAKGDERLEALERVSRQLNFEEGEHLRLAYAIERVLMERFDESMNVNGYMSAFLSDQAFTPQEVYRMFGMLVASGVTACYLDTLQRPSGTFLPLRCDDVEYQGKGARELQR